MEPYTLNRQFLKKDIIDSFTSFIWTDRFFGDTNTELVVPRNSEILKLLPAGIFLGIDESDEICILETYDDTDDGKVKITGISLLKWLNNRFIRTSDNPEDKYWYVSGNTPSAVLWMIVHYMCRAESPYLNGDEDTGIPFPHRFAIPGLYLNAYDNTGSHIDIGIPFGPVYDTMREIAVTYNVGMQIILEYANETDYRLGFRSYKGLNRTSTQSVNPYVRFSPQTDTFAGIKELESIAAYITDAYVFASTNPDGLANQPGTASIPGASPTGFDLRARQEFADDLTSDVVEGSSMNMLRMLNARAEGIIGAGKKVHALDGEIVQTNQYQYGKHYNLGDIIEVQGRSGILKQAQVMEYIRTQDASGEKAYPTVEILN